MTRHRLPAGLLMLAHAACFWPVWRWYVDRLDDGSVSGAAAEQLAPQALVEPDECDGQPGHGGEL